MDVPVWTAGLAQRSPYGIVLLPPGSRVAAYVRSTGGQSGDDPQLANNMVTTLAAGLARARSGLGDSVICLPGHSESVADATMLDNLVPGTRIVGIGQGSNMPVFRWTATGSQWVLNDADVSISGLRLRLEGANGVVKAILCTAADNNITGCDIEVASGATAKATIALEFGAGAHRFNVAGNRFRGTATHNATDGIKIVAAVTDGRVADNEMVFSATATSGLIHATAAALGLKILRNMVYNTHTASSSAIVVDAVAATGIIGGNWLGTLASSASQPLLIGAGADLRLFENYASDTGGASTVSQSGILNPPGVTL